MGGLDARYVISHLPSSQYSIASLTTLSTPHRGSSFMDYLRDTTGLGSLRPAWNEVTIRRGNSREPKKPLESKEPLSRTHPLVKAIFSTIDAPAFYNLTTEYCSAFNAVSPNSPSTRYFSYAAAAQISRMAPLYFSHQIVSRYEGENDGLVSVKSAQWGEYLGRLDCDHWEIVPPKIRALTPLGRTKGHTTDLYLSLATRLCYEGC